MTDLHNGPSTTPSRRAANDGPARAALGSVLIAALVLVTLRDLVAFVVDDAFITFRFARNWADWGVPTFNSFDLAEGGRPVEGYSNALWMGLMSLFDRAGLDVVRAASACQLALGVGTLSILAGLAGRTLGLGTIGTLSAPLLLATMAPFVVWTSGGMETTLFTFLLALTFRLGLGPRGREARNADGLVLGLAAAGVVLVRVEGIAWALGTLGAIAAARRLAGPSSRPGRYLWIGAAAALLTFAAHGLWRELTYGSWLPNTVLAKSGGDPQEVFGRGARHVASWALVTLTPIAFLATLVPALRHPRAGARIAAWAGGVIVLGFVLYNLAVGGDWMPFFRFLAPAAPLLALGMAIGLDRLGRPLGLLLAGAIVLLQPLPLYGVHLAPESLRESLRFRAFEGGYRSEIERIDAARTNSIYFETLGRALAEGTKPGDVLGFGAIGAPGWFAPRLDFLDRNGLVTPEVARREGGEAGTAGHDKRVPHAWFLQHGEPPARYLFATWIDGLHDPARPEVLRALKEVIRRNGKLAAPGERQLFERTVLTAVPLADVGGRALTLLLLERAEPSVAARFWSR